MREICILFLSLFSSVTVLGQRSKPLTLTGRVVDSRAQPVAGAEVAAYEKFYDYSGGEDYVRLFENIKITDANGHCVITGSFHRLRNVFVVARKRGLALGWDVVTHRIGANGKYVAGVNIVLESPCSLAGRVIDETNKPVAGAKVRALPKTSYLRQLRQSPILAPKQWFSTQTDAKGNFSFNNFAPDVSADFWVKAPGWASVYKYTTCYLSSCGFEAGRTDIRLVLPTEVPIHGRVVDAESGSPVVGASLVIEPDNIREHKNPYCANQTVSGQGGQFDFEGVPPGKHYINVSVPKETMRLVDKKIKFDVQADQAAKEVIVELDKGGLIEIVAREATARKPISDIAVYFYQAIQNEHSNFYKHSITGKNGTLRVWAPPGECQLSARCDGYFPEHVQDQVMVTQGQTSRLEILLDRNPNVSGIVLDEFGKPMPAVLVMAQPAGDEVLTEGDGRFEAGFNQSWPCEYLFARCIERNLAAIVDVKDHSKPRKIAIKPALSIVGQVADPNGVGIPAARLSLWVRLSSCLSPFGSETLADAQGRYQMRAIPPEQTGFVYRISVNASGYGSKAWKRVSITGEPGTSVEMKTIVLQPADQSISGVVVNAEGEPVGRVPVFLHGSGQLKKSSATDNNGRFTIKRICKGPLRLQANFANSPGGEGNLKAQGGDKDVKIILGQEGVWEPYVSLIGKPLPELKDLKIELTPADVGDQMMLVCFFDMDQRPSRHMVRELAKSAEHLKEKKVTIVLVQASKVDENALNEWVKKHNIAFPVGMVKADEQKTRLNWGVKSLPWLILTDGGRIVRAEGFALKELDEKLETLHNTKSP